MYVCMYICIYVYICVCTHIYTYIHTYIHTYIQHTYIYIYIHIYTFFFLATMESEFKIEFYSLMNDAEEHHGRTSWNRVTSWDIPICTKYAYLFFFFWHFTLQTYIYIHPYNRDNIYNISVYNINFLYIHKYMYVCVRTCIYLSLKW